MKPIIRELKKDLDFTPPARKNFSVADVLGFCVGLEDLGCLDKSFGASDIKKVKGSIAAKLPKKLNEALGKAKALKRVYGILKDPNRRERIAALREELKDFSNITIAITDSNEVISVSFAGQEVEE